MLTSVQEPWVNLLRTCFQTIFSCQTQKDNDVTSQRIQSPPQLHKKKILLPLNNCKVWLPWVGVTPTCLHIALIYQIVRNMNSYSNTVCPAKFVPEDVLFHFYALMHRIDYFQEYVHEIDFRG
jgi:hypothetical protein